MIDVRFRPLGVWPFPETRPRRSRHTFKAGWQATLDLLHRELSHLNAHQPVIQIDVTEDDLRLDGWPRANARVGHPGVIVSFHSDHGPLQYATDTHEWWQHNIRAIALGLEALRAVDRYGITRRGEQYQGWKALPTGDGPTTREQAAKIIAAAIRDVAEPDALEATLLRGDPVYRRRIIRDALRHAHPDHGGTPEAFDLVQRARRILEEAVPT